MQLHNTMNVLHCEWFRTDWEVNQLNLQDDVDFTKVSGDFPHSGTGMPYEHAIIE